MDMIICISCLPIDVMHWFQFCLACWKLCGLVTSFQHNAKCIQCNHKVNNQITMVKNNPTKPEAKTHGPHGTTKVFTNGTVNIQRSQHVQERVNMRKLHPCAGLWQALWFNPVKSMRLVGDNLPKSALGLSLHVGNRILANQLTHPPFSLPIPPAFKISFWDQFVGTSNNSHNFIPIDP